jgi:hypothetical protein
MQLANPDQLIRCVSGTIDNRSLSVRVMGDGSIHFEQGTLSRNPEQADSQKLFYTHDVWVFRCRECVEFVVEQDGTRKS